MVASDFCFAFACGPETLLVLSSLKQFALVPSILSIVLHALLGKRSDLLITPTLQFY